MSHKFCNIFGNVLVCGVYIMWPKQFKVWKVPTVVGSIVVVGVLTSYALLYLMCDLKAAQMNMQWELMVYEFKLGHDSVETTKNICCAKDEGAVDHCYQKFCSGCKKLDDQAGSHVGLWILSHCDKFSE